MTVKAFATGVAAAAAIGAAAGGVTSVGCGTLAPPADPVRQVAVSAPLPQDPPPGQPALPTADQLSSLCTQATDPGGTEAGGADLRRRPPGRSLHGPPLRAAPALRNRPGFGAT